MATVTLLPDGGTAGSWSHTGGAANFIAAVTDGSDTTYANSTGMSQTVTLTFATSTIPGTINSVTLKMRALINTFSDKTPVVQQKVGASYNADEGWTLTSSFANYTGTAHTTKPGGGAWDQAAIDALEIEFTNPNEVGQMQVAEISAEVDYTPSTSSHQMVV